MLLLRKSFVLLLLSVFAFVSILETHITVCVCFQNSLFCLGMSLGSRTTHWAIVSLNHFTIPNGLSLHFCHPQDTGM